MSTLPYSCAISIQFIVIKVSLVEKNGRKSKVAGRVEDLKGTLLVEATYVSRKRCVHAYLLIASRSVPLSYNHVTPIY